MLQQSTLLFLKNLKKHNHKSWMDSHRDNYESARADFAAFIQLLINKFGIIEPDIAHLSARDCLFRINRDIRFSKNKTPYKTNFGASINRDGKKSVKAGYYFHLEPGASFVGGGIWHPMTAELTQIRQEIDYNLPEFKKIIGAKKFTSVYGNLYKEENQVLARVPKGYEPGNPAAEYLKYKSYLAIAQVPDHILTDKQLLNQAVRAFEALKPLVQFINRALDE